MNKLEPYKDDIIERYKNGEGLKLIAKNYDCDKGSIKKLLIKNGVEIRKTQQPYPIDETYFDHIDSPNKAYILGFLYADGCNTTGNKIKLSLQVGDKEVLEKIRSELNYNKPLSYYKRAFKNPKHQDMYELIIYNKHMSEQLTLLGCTPRKSLTLQFPKWLSKELLPHFLRGYFDGDGSINRCARGARATITSSYDFCSELHNILNDMEIKNKLVHAPTNEKTGIISITSKDNTKKFLDYIYENADLYMERKHSLYLEKIYKIKKE